MRKKVNDVWYDTGDAAGSFYAFKTAAFCHERKPAELRVAAKAILRMYGKELSPDEVSYLKINVSP